MARLFITPREIDFISDITKEITKDVIGDKIYYYRVREDATQVHTLYEESPEKVVDPPVEIDARVQWNPKEVTSDRFGTHAMYNCEVYIHYRDMLDRNIKIVEGDFFTHGDNVFEITSYTYDKTIFGQVEHIVGFNVKGKQTRKGVVDLKIWGPTERKYTDPDAIRDTFQQQRGDATMGDNRILVDQGKVDDSLHTQREVKKDDTSSSFYGDEP
jgi:hypothetical protein